MSLSVLVTHPFQFTIKLNSLKQQTFIISKFLMVRNLEAVQWLRLSPSSACGVAWGVGLIPGREAKIPHAWQQTTKT